MKQGWCMQSNFPASFWSQEGIFLALLSGAGAFHRLVQEGGHWQGNFEVHTLAPSSFMDWHCHSHPGAYQGGLGLMEGSGHAALLELGLSRCCGDPGHIPLSLLERNEENSVEVYSQFTIFFPLAFYQFPVIQNIQIFMKTQTDTNTSGKVPGF